MRRRERLAVVDPDRDVQSSTDTAIQGWLRSFTLGRWHAVVVSGNPFRDDQLVTLCGIPIPDYEQRNVRPSFDADDAGCATCHAYLGCAHDHDLGTCPVTCGCPCAASRHVADD